MLTGKALGQAIRQAIELKLASGAARTKVEIAKHFGVQPPSLHDWINSGTISKDKLPALWAYFADVVGPEHWGMDHIPARAQVPPEHLELLALFDKLSSQQQADVLDNLRQTVQRNQTLIRELANKYR